MYQEKTRAGWRLVTQQTLTDEEAAALVIRATPDQVTLGEYVEVEDGEGTRIGHVESATYRQVVFGPAYVEATIHLT